MADAQLGQQANINLGGYVPAPARQPKIWQQVLAQFLGNVAQEGVQNLTAPDMSKTTQPWYKRNPNQSEIASQANVQLGKDQLQLNKDEAGVRKTRSEAETAQGATRLEQEDRKLQLEGLLGGAQMADIQNRGKIAEGQLALAKDQFVNAKTEQERDAAFKQIQILMHLNDMRFDQQIKTQELGLKSGIAHDTVSKTPAEIDELRARAEYERGLGRQTSGAKLTPAELKAQLQQMLKP